MLHPTKRTALVLFSLLSLPAVHAADAPRYKLQPGQHLTYTTTGETKYDGGSFSSTGQSDVYVTSRQPDGSARLLLLTSTTRNNNTSHTLTSCTLSPTGQLTVDPPAGPEPIRLFPLLPPTADAHTWKSDPDPFGSVRTYTLAPSTSPSTLVFTSTEDRPENKIYQISSSTTDHFDTTRGLLDHSDSTLSQDNQMHAKGTGTTRLTAVEQLSPVALATLTADATTCRAALKSYQDALDAVDRDPKLIDSLASADQPLKDAATKVHDRAIKDLLTTQIDRHKQSLPYLKESAQQHAALLNKPAPDFSTTDYDGHSHTLSDLRGKVVLLDFWYRGCGWCIRAMPQLKQLADDFKGQPVAILGMNTDHDPADARFVMKEMSLNYPTLIAGPYPEKLNIHAFPTLLLIDRQGTVRDIHEGFSPTLRQDLSDQIRALLRDHE